MEKTSGEAGGHPFTRLRAHVTDPQEEFVAQEEALMREGSEGVGARSAAQDAGRLRDGVAGGVDVFRRALRGDTRPSVKATTVQFKPGR